MLEYQRFLNAQGYQTLARPCLIPDFRLMVGSAECLHELPVMRYEDYISPQAAAVVNPIQKMPAEQVDPKLVGVTYTPNDFIQGDWFLGPSTAS